MSNTLTPQPTTIRRSFASTIVRAFNTIGKTIGTVEQTVDAATQWVDNRAIKLAITDLDYIQTETARDLRALKAELDADAELKAIKVKLEKNWHLPD